MANRLPDNLELWQNLKTHLNDLNISLQGFPIVFQFNKQDIPNAISSVILKNVLNINGYPTFNSVAIKGQGVFDTLKAITADVVKRVQQEMS